MLNPAAAASPITRVTNARSWRRWWSGGCACCGVAVTNEPMPRRVDDAGALELGVDAGDGVGVDAEVDGELADGGELIADLEAAGGDRGAEAAIELGVDRGAVPRVDGNERPGRHLS